LGDFSSCLLPLLGYGANIISKRKEGMVSTPFVINNIHSLSDASLRFHYMLTAADNVILGQSNHLNVSSRLEDNDDIAGSNLGLSTAMGGLVGWLDQRFRGLVAGGLDGHWENGCR
jgi:hypothetical protein